MEEAKEKLKIIDHLVSTGQGTRMQHLVAQHTLQELRDLLQELGHIDPPSNQSTAIDTSE